MIMFATLDTRLFQLVVFGILVCCDYCFVLGTSPNDEIVLNIKDTFYGNELNFDDDTFSSDTSVARADKPTHFINLFKDDIFDGDKSQNRKYEEGFVSSQSKNKVIEEYRENIYDKVYKSRIIRQANAGYSSLYPQLPTSPPYNQYPQHNYNVNNNSYSGHPNSNPSGSAYNTWRPPYADNNHSQQNYPSYNSSQHPHYPSNNIFPNDPNYQPHNNSKYDYPSYPSHTQINPYNPSGQKPLYNSSGHIYPYNPSAGHSFPNNSQANYPTFTPSYRPDNRPNIYNPTSQRSPYNPSSNNPPYYNPSSQRTPYNPSSQPPPTNQRPGYYPSFNNSQGNYPSPYPGYRPANYSTSYNSSNQKLPYNPANQNSYTPTAVPFYNNVPGYGQTNYPNSYNATNQLFPYNSPNAQYPGHNPGYNLANFTNPHVSTQRPGLNPYQPHNNPSAPPYDQNNFYYPPQNNVTNNYYDPNKVPPGQFSYY